MAFLFHSQYFDPEVWRSAIHSVDPSVDFRTLHQMGDPAEIECLMAWRPPPGTFSRLSNLKLIYSTGAGVDGLLGDPERPTGIPVARVFDSQLVRDMTSFVIGAVLRHHLRFDFYQHQQLTEAWHIPPHVPTTSRRVGIMGLGRLGGAAAEHLARLGFQVAGWTLQRRMDIQEVNCYTGEAGLSEFLARTDFGLHAAITPATRHIVNGKLLSSLPKGAAFINVGRGAHVMERDLLGALNEHLSGATLDVFEQEPLPASHVFWKHPKVFITPHVATRVNPYSAAPEVVANYNRIKTGEAFTNLVDEVKGY